MIKTKNSCTVLAVVLATLMLLGAVLPAAVAESNIKESIKGFDKGIPWQPFKPLKKVTFVGFDKKTLIDDYSYLASIPASVFSDGNTIFASPLLFFQPENSYPDEDKYRFLNDYSGTHYLMEDWMSYCDGRLDKLTTINVKQADLESTWKSRQQTVIEDDDPYKIASEIALDEWSYSDDAVVAVIEKEYKKPENTRITNSVSGKLQGKVGKETLKIKRPYGPAPEFEHFTVEDEYKYVRADLYYPALVYHSLLLSLIPGFGRGLVTFPSLDPDLQIYCKYEGDWLQTGSSSEMTITNGPHEECLSYVYKPGSWRVGVTNMPTEGMPAEKDFKQNGPLGKITFYGNKWEAIQHALLGKSMTTYYCDITKYPGVEEIIPDLPPFGCRDATFKLTWDNEDVTLGLTILGPSGEELESVMEPDVDYQEIHFDQLGECIEGEHYKAVVYCLDDVTMPVHFTIEYSWQQNITRREADLIASACEGAILGSIINAPLLYTAPGRVPSCTIEAINKLGVKQIYIVDLGGYLSNAAKETLSSNAHVKKHYVEYNDIYDEIMQRTSSNDIVFSTIDPWSYWYYNESIAGLKPAGEYKGAFYFAPAAYAAAFHGCPLLLVDNHPELSGAVTWHAEFWKKNANGFTIPPVATMFLTGSKIRDFLKKNGFDKDGVKESILTVAGQYEIGPTWSRIFPGIAYPGNIIGTPVDTSNAIVRNVFYPALIFQNPALQGEVELINGSVSERVQPTLLRPFKRLWARVSPSTLGLSNLKIVRESGPEKYKYPVLHTYGCYGHRFNERGSKYWGTYYHTRTGHIPGVDISNLEIDEGTRLKYEGKAGAFLPDISESEITPFYASKAGYSNVFSTNFDITMENLNRGVISWYMVLHGYSGNGGILAWFSPTSIAEMLEMAGVPFNVGKTLNKIVGVPLGLNPVTDVNPWRGYDMFWGSTEEPDTATLNAEIGLILGWLGVGDRDGPAHGGLLKLGLDLIPSNIPFKIPLLNNRENYYDGLVGPYSLTAMLTRFHYAHPATEVDDKLGNLHSMNFHADSCLIAGNYLHIALMRHGSVAQEIDPWPTSYWGGYVFEQTPKDFALGKTIGEAYSEGRCEIGVQYLFEEGETREWWWDIAENVVLFSDPDLRIWVPSTEWDDKARNHWEREDVEAMKYDSGFSVDGHMPYGATEYPHAREPLPLMQLIIIVALIIILIVGATVLAVKSKKGKKGRKKK